MGDDAGRFVHHEQVLVLVGDVEVHVLGYEVGQLRRWQADFDLSSPSAHPEILVALLRRSTGTRPAAISFCAAAREPISGAAATAAGRAAAVVAEVPPVMLIRVHRRSL